MENHQTFRILYHSFKIVVLRGDANKYSVADIFFWGGGGSKSGFRLKTLVSISLAQARIANIVPAIFKVEL